MTYLILCYFFTLPKYEFQCWQYKTHKNYRKQTWYREQTSNTMGAILCLVPVSTAQILYPDCDLKTMSTFHGSLWGNKHGDTRFFFPAFAKNNLIKNIFEKEKKFDNRTCLFLENSSALGVFWLRRGLQANHGTVRKSAKSPQPGNQKQVKWSNTVYFNKRSFNFKIKFCVFQVTKAKFCMKVIRIFNAQPVKIPILRARWRVNKHGDPIFLLHFFNVYIMNVNYTKFQKKFDSRTISRELP